MKKVHKFENQRLSRIRLGWSRKIVCTKCGLVMRDSEPMQFGGEFWHRRVGCVNDEISFSFETERHNAAHCVFSCSKRGGRGIWVKRKVHGIQQFSSKAERRARKRGSKMASRLRPR